MVCDLVAQGRVSNVSSVLILVVVEDGLRLVLLTIYFTFNFVLILVVVEDGLRPRRLASSYAPRAQGLNPCCSGRWSATGVPILVAIFGE